MRFGDKDRERNRQKFKNKKRDKFKKVPTEKNHAWKKRVRELEEDEKDDDEFFDDFSEEVV